MTTTTNFIGAVYDELARLLGVAPGTASFLQMAWPGYALSPADFKPSSAQTGPYDPVVARETFSQLVNIEPAFSASRFENSGLEVDDMYEILLASAIPSGTTQDTIATNPLYHLFSEAQFELMQAKRGLHDDPSGFYYPCSATPVDWFDEAAAQGWPTLTLRQSDVKPTPAVPPRFTRPGLKEAAALDVWRLRPSAAVTASLRDKLAAIRPGRILGAPAPSIASAGRLKKPGVGPLKPTITPAEDSPIKRRFTPARAPDPSLARHAPDVARIDLSRRDLGVASLAQRLALKAALDRELPTEPASPATDGFTISFKFCRVNIDRPWLKLALLSTRNWWMFDTPSGEYSTGAADDNPGKFPLLTTSFIAIRDLKITANWSAEDRGHLTEASSFGFFDLQGGTVTNNTLEVRGLQVIAWISRLMPRLPPQSPPATEQ